MIPGRTFHARLQQLQKAEKIEPVVFIPVLELFEELLIDFQETCMADKEIAPDEKGRIATTLTPLLRGVRQSRESILAARERPEQAKPKLHNRHLQ